MEESEGNSLQSKGRARSSLTEFFPPRTPVPKGKCGDMPYTETLDSVKTISVEPDGRVAVCENFHVGNAFKSDIIDILENYDPYKIPEAKSILEKGMDGLIKWAKKKMSSQDLRDTTTFVTCAPIFEKEQALHARIPHPTDPQQKAKRWLLWILVTIRTFYILVECASWFVILAGIPSFCLRFAQCVVLPVVQ